MTDYWQTMIWPMLEGAKMTVILFFIAILISIPFGFLLTLAVKSRIKPLSWLAHTYILYHAWYTTIATIIINLLWSTYAASNR